MLCLMEHRPPPSLRPPRHPAYRTHTPTSTTRHRARKSAPSAAPIRPGEMIRNAVCLCARDLLVRARGCSLDASIRKKRTWPEGPGHGRKDAVCRCCGVFGVWACCGGGLLDCTCAVGWLGVSVYEGVCYGMGWEGWGAVPPGPTGLSRSPPRTPDPTTLHARYTPATNHPQDTSPQRPNRFCIDRPPIYSSSHTPPKPHPKDHTQPPTITPPPGADQASCGCTPTMHFPSVLGTSAFGRAGFALVWMPGGRVAAALGPGKERC